MRWIVLAIVIAIAGYSFLTLHYRKPGRAYEPYAEMKARANTGRLLAAGYQRIELPVERPATPAAQPNSAFPAPGGLPAELAATVVSPPHLAQAIVAVSAPSVAMADAPYSVEFRCTAPDDAQQLGNVHLYLKRDSLVLAPNFERLPGGLETRTRDVAATITLPAQTLKPGAYDVRLVGQGASRAWRLQVR